MNKLDIYRYECRKNAREAGRARLKAQNLTNPDKRSAQLGKAAQLAFRSQCYQALMELEIGI